MNYNDLPVQLPLVYRDLLQQQPMNEMNLEHYFGAHGILLLTSPQMIHNHHSDWGQYLHTGSKLNVWRSDAYYLLYEYQVLITSQSFLKPHMSYNLILYELIVCCVVLFFELTHCTNGTTRETHDSKALALNHVHLLVYSSCAACLWAPWSRHIHT